MTIDITIEDVLMLIALKKSELPKELTEHILAHNPIYDAFLKSNRRIIEKLCWTPYFDDILTNNKKFDIRLDNFDCNVGDIILFREYNQKKKEETGRLCFKEVRYKVKTDDFTFWNKTEIEKYGYLVLGF